MLTTDPKQALLDRTANLIEKTSAAVLWKYTDEEGGDFYLPEKKIGPLKSPYSGKSFTGKPERSSMGDVGKELKEEGAKVKGALFKYVDGDGKEFFLPKKMTGTLKSPYSGKSFTPKAEKSTLNDVGKELKNKEATPSRLPSKGGKVAIVSGSEEQWEMAAEILEQGESHPALKVLTDQFGEVVKGLKEAAQRSARLKKVGVGRTEDPTLVLALVMPEIKTLAEKAALVAKQMEQRFK
jgi:hypothetical protein